MYCLIVENALCGKRRRFFKTSEVCKYLDENWEFINDDKTRTPTWPNTISAAITTRRDVFLQSAEIGLEPGRMFHV